MYDRERKTAANLSVPEQMLFVADRLCAGNLELSAESQLEATNDLHISKDVAWHRIGAMGWEIGEVVSRAAEVYGLSSVAPTMEMFGKDIPVIAVLGFIGEGVSAWQRGKCENPIGAKQNTAMMKVLKETLPVRTHIRAGLLAAGFSDEQINKIDSLPLDLYVAQFGTTNRTLVSNVLNPLLTGAAMAAYGDHIQGSIIAGLGLLGFPIGKRLYDASSLTKRKIELSASARNYIYRMKVYIQEHFPRTEAINLLTATPKFLKGVALLQGFQDSMARLTGIGNSLIGLSGLLSAMRTRYDNQRLVEMTKRMISTMNSESFLFRENNFNAHAKEAGFERIKLPYKDFQGLLVRDLKVRLPNNKDTNLDPVSFDVAKGEVLVLKGKNGDGKSVLFSGILQVLNHEGHVALVGENGQVNLHDFINSEDPMETIRECIMSSSVRNMNGVSEIVDILAPAFNVHFETPLFEDQDEQLEFEVGCAVGNNLLRQEVRAFESGKTGKDKAVFSETVMKELAAYYEQRRQWTAEILVRFGADGSLSDAKINPERMIETLSDGEQTALSILSLVEHAKTKPSLKAVLLDEPMRGLDRTVNLQVVLEKIDELRCVNSGLSVVVITHEHDEDLVEKFGSRIINLSK